MKICECGNKKSKKSKLCKNCDSLRREKILWPEYQKLIIMVNNYGYSKTAKKLEVSRTAIVNRLEKYGALPVI